MERYSLIVVADETAPIRRYDILKSAAHRALWGAGLLVVLLAVGLVDYVSVRADVPEFEALKVEAAEQRERIEGFETTLAELNQKREHVREFERKVRIIANLPGSAGVGGEVLVELVPGDDGVVALPIGVPVDRAPQTSGAHGGQGGGSPMPAQGEESATATFFDRLDDKAIILADGAQFRAESLDGLLGQLDDKRQRLVSMPSIWPSKGWLTSRFGPRVSPFTGRRQLHNGIDVAAADGTPIYAPARGRVTFAGRKGPLGNALVLDHGFGVKTVYGHTKEILVATGETVERGDKIASIGSSGRSTGPHLHYVVEVKGKARNPLDYIFD